MASKDMRFLLMNPRQGRIHMNTSDLSPKNTSLIPHLMRTEQRLGTTGTCLCLKVAGQLRCQTTASTHSWEILSQMIHYEKAQCLKHHGPMLFIV